MPVKSVHFCHILRHSDLRKVQDRDDPSFCSNAHCLAEVSEPAAATLAGQPARPLPVVPRAKTVDPPVLVNLELVTARRVRGFHILRQGRRQAIKRNDCTCFPYSHHAISPSRPRNNGASTVGEDDRFSTLVTSDGLLVCARRRVPYPDFLIPRSRDDEAAVVRECD
jgi:hypothetical protein